MIQTYSLDRSGAPLYEQLYRALKADILSGALPGGEKLPSGRALSEHLGVSRGLYHLARARGLFCRGCDACGAAFAGAGAFGGESIRAAAHTDAARAAVSVLGLGAADARRAP